MSYLNPKKYVVPTYEETADGWIISGLRAGKYPVRSDLADNVAKKIKAGCFFPYTYESYTVDYIAKIIIFQLVLMSDIRLGADK